MGEYARAVMGEVSIFSVVVIIWIINSRMSSSYKLTWAIIVAGLPVVGTLLYIYTHFNLGANLAFLRMRTAVKETHEYEITSEPVKSRIKAEDPDFGKIIDYMEKEGFAAAFDNTEVKYYSLADEVFPVMCEELEKAESFIFMEYFIIEEGIFWDTILEILVRKAAEGVEVRLMYDDMGSINTLPRKYAQLLNQLNIQAMVFAKVRPFLSTYYNNRDHRKLTVIDGKIAFSGGYNLADEYINKAERFGHWKDNAFILKGDAVRSYTMMFLQMWQAGTIPEEKQNFARYIDVYNERTPIPEKDGFVIPYADGPHQAGNVAENVYIDVINNAVRHVAVMTPYFIPDNELLHAVKHAARSGVEVILILPHIPDKKIINVLTKSYYRELLRAGIRIFEYTPGFVHSKLMVADDEIAVMGTVNMDYRSLYLHYECGSIVYKNEAVLEAEADVSMTLEKCTEITYETTTAKGVWFWFFAGILRVFSPLL
jgi:cardiolipin synthase